MGDNIFDDVDDILNGDMSDDDKSFNESELQDIMSEIEDLEKEFVSEEAPAMSLQDKIEAELFAETEKEKITTSAKPIAEPKAEILSFVKAPAPKSNPSPATNDVAFEARGTMSLNLDFKVGDETAKLCIDPTKGLLVTVAGVELCIDEESGCTVKMDNGMKFTIPLSSAEKSLKKKAS